MTHFSINIHRVHLPADIIRYTRKLFNSNPCRLFLLSFSLISLTYPVPVRVVDYNSHFPQRSSNTKKLFSSYFIISIISKTAVMIQMKRLTGRRRWRREKDRRAYSNDCDLKSMARQSIRHSNASVCKGRIDIHLIAAGGVRANTAPNET